MAHHCPDCALLCDCTAGDALTYQCVHCDEGRTDLDVIDDDELDPEEIDDDEGEDSP